MACGGCAGAKNQPLAIVAACFSQPTQLGGVLHGFRGNGARLRALVRRGADRFGELGLDQGLADGFGGLADAVADIGDLECVQGFEQGRLVQGHRVAPLYVFLGGFTQRHAVASPPCSGTPRRPQTYTTSGDATRFGVTCCKLAVRGEAADF